MQVTIAYNNKEVEVQAKVVGHDVDLPRQEFDKVLQSGIPPVVLTRMITALVEFVKAGHGNVPVASFDFKTSKITPVQQAK